VLLGDRVDALDERRESAHRVEHAVGEVEVAHEVVHRRGVERRGAEEDGGVAEHLAQTQIVEAVRDVGVEVLQEHLHELRRALQHVGREERAERLEARVEEAALGHLVRVYAESR